MNNTSKYLFLVISAVIITTVGIGYYFYLQNQPKFTDYKDPHLTSEELSTIDNKIKDEESNVHETEKSGSKEDQFKLYMALSADYELRGRLLDAKNAADKATKALPYNPTGWGQLYSVQSARGDFRSAESAVRTAIQRNPANPQYWRSLVEISQDGLHKTQDDMEKIFKDALNQTNENPDVLVLYAKFQESKNDLQGAVDSLKKAIDKNPNNRTEYQTEIQKIQKKLQ
jgi:tetratricopeptide (TPR) repeat protein